MDKMLEMLIKCGKISVEDMEAARMSEIQEVLMKNDITMPKITERKRGNSTRFYCVMPARYSKTGKRHQIVGSTRKECEKRFQKEAYDHITDSRDIDSMRVCDLMEEWMHAKKNGVKPQTVSGYYSHYESYIKKSAFGALLIGNVRLPECQNFIDSLYKFELGYDTIRHIKSEVSMALDYAVAHEYILRNCMPTVKINRNLCSTRRAHETEAWTDEELRTIARESKECWENGKKYRYSALLMFLACSGCRIGEVVAATWDDIDWKNGTFNISKTYARYHDYESGKFVTECSSPKTPSSRRLLKMTDEALFWLHEIKKRQHEIGVISPYIAANRNGNVANQRDLNMRFKNFCEVIGIKYKPSHAGRRTYASIMAQNGIPLPDIAADLGHKNITTTQNCYNKRRTAQEKILRQKNAIMMTTLDNTPEELQICIK